MDVVFVCGYFHAVPPVVWLQNAAACSLPPVSGFNAYFGSDRKARGDEAIAKRICFFPTSRNLKSNPLSHLSHPHPHSLIRCFGVPFLALLSLASSKVCKFFVRKLTEQIQLSSIPARVQAFGLTWRHSSSAPVLSCKVSGNCPSFLIPATLFSCISPSRPRSISQLTSSPHQFQHQRV